MTIDSLLTLLEHTDESDLIEIDQRIAQHKTAIEKLLKARKLLGGVASTGKKSIGRRSHSGLKLSDQIVQWMRENNRRSATNQELCEALGCKHQAISMAVVKNSDTLKNIKGEIHLVGA